MARSKGITDAAAAGRTASHPAAAAAAAAAAAVELPRQRWFVIKESGPVEVVEQVCNVCNRSSSGNRSSNINSSSSSADIIGS
jgi:hypothetical protein